MCSYLEENGIMPSLPHNSPKEPQIKDRLQWSSARPLVLSPLEVDRETDDFLKIVRVFFSI